VLGGGGPVGVAWETGLAAGLDEGGVRLADAGLIVGTSAGSIVGAQLALGRSPQDMLTAQLDLNERASPRHRAVRQPFDASELMAHLGKLYTSDAPVEQVRAEVGAFALGAQTMTEEEWFASFGSLDMLGAGAWPERDFRCTAIDVADGTFAVWDRNSGVELRRAIASSCAVPGMVPPVTILGRRYMDGGIGSTTNAELAAGYDNVLIVSVTGNLGRRAPEIVERVRARFEAELSAVRDAGSAVELIAPDDASREAFGTNLLDGTRRREVAEAGRRQGRLEAARLRESWG